MMRQNKLFRDKGTTGNLRELVQSMSIQPAMLLYLDNADNTRHSPNQNFARELLELFLLGVGNYTEHEIESCTLAWTGPQHQLGRPKRYEFYRQHHASGRKTIFGRTAAFDGPGRVGPGVIDLVLGRTDGSRPVRTRVNQRDVLRLASCPRSCGRRSPTRIRRAPS